MSFGEFNQSHCFVVSAGLMLIDLNDNTHTHTRTHTRTHFHGPWYCPWWGFLLRHHLSAGCPSRKWALRIFQWRFWLCFQDASTCLHSHPVVPNVTFAHLSSSSQKMQCVYVVTLGKIKFPCHLSDIAELQFHFHVQTKWWFIHKNIFASSFNEILKKTFSSFDWHVMIPSPCPSSLDKKIMRIHQS